MTPQCQMCGVAIPAGRLFFGVADVGVVCAGCTEAHDLYDRVTLAVNERQRPSGVA